jgi:hypothetical protein
MVTDFPGYGPVILGCANDVLYFTATDGTHGKELWRLFFPQGPQSPNGPAIELVQPTAEDQLHIYPNPSSGSISVDFKMAQPGNASFDLLDTRGRHIRSLGHQDLPAGKQTLTFSLETLPNGIYLLRCTLPAQQLMAKLLRK